MKVEVAEQSQEICRGRRGAVDLSALALYEYSECNEQSPPRTAAGYNNTALQQVQQVLYDKYKSTITIFSLLFLCQFVDVSPMNLCQHVSAEAPLYPLHIRITQLRMRCLFSTNTTVSAHRDRPGSSSLQNSQPTSSDQRLVPVETSHADVSLPEPCTGGGNLSTGRSSCCVTARKID